MRKASRLVAGEPILSGWQIDRRRSAGEPDREHASGLGSGSSNFRP
jgi:hypothetical protein